MGVDGCQSHRVTRTNHSDGVGMKRREFAVARLVDDNATEPVFCVPRARLRPSQGRWSLQVIERCTLLISIGALPVCRAVQGNSGAYDGHIPFPGPAVLSVQEMGPVSSQCRSAPRPPVPPVPPPGRLHTSQFPWRWERRRSGQCGEIIRPEPSSTE